MKVDIEKYLGEWFEIARIKNAFQSNMTNVKAQYTLNTDNSIQVINSGVIHTVVMEIIGTAITTEEDNLLKVSFFPNIYSDYKILYVDEDYQYAVVGGENKNYLWILSRTPHIDDIVLYKLIDIAKDNEYEINKLILTEQNNE
jgi:apolipoprotein D and lipocalin family protein